MGWYVFLMAVVAVAVIMSEREAGKLGKNRREDKPKSTVKSQDNTLLDDDEFQAYPTRRKRKNAEKQRKRKDRFKDDEFEDHGIYVDKDGNEHSLDYDDYCDECDEYHDE